MTLVGLLIALFIVAVIIYAIVLLLRMVPLDPQLKQFVWLIVAVLMLVFLYSVLTGSASLPALK